MPRRAPTLRAVGLLDWFRRDDKQIEAKAAAAPAVVEAAKPAREVGISGTTNYQGSVLAEANTKLVHELAYGIPGTRTWGEWERILRTDPAVAVSLEFVKAQLRDARVDVQPAPEEVFADRKRAELQAAYVKWNLLEALEPSWTEVIQQMAGQIIPGFALHEVVMARCLHPSLPGGSGFKVAKLAERLPVSIHPQGWIERDGELHTIKQQGIKDSRWETLDLPADCVLLNSWNRSGNNYPGFSAYRSVWYLCKIREELAKMVGIALTREGAGIPIATCTDKATELDPEERRRLEELLANLVFHENASAVMPAGWTMQWVYSPGANKGHVVDAYNALGTIILQVVFAQQLQLGVNGTGSRSVGEVHNSTADIFVQGLAASIEGVLNGVGQRPYTGLVRKLVSANWGPQPAYPRIALTLKKAKLPPQEKALATKTAIDAGALTVTLEIENALREELGYSPISEEDWTAERERKSAVALEIAKSRPPAFGKKPGDDDEDDEDPRDKKLARLSSGLFQPRRALRPSERHLDLAAMSRFLDVSKETFERGAKPIVAEMLTKVLPDVKAAARDGRIEHEEIAAIALDTERLEAFIGEYLERAREEGYRQVKGERARQLGHQLAAGDDDKDPPTDEEPDEVDELLEAQRRQLARRIKDRLRAQLEAEAIAVTRTDGNADQVVSRVLTDQLESKALQSDAGLVMTTAFNLGREEFAQEYADSVDSVELSAVLDDGTCGPCESMDGTEFDFGSPEYERNTPPLRDCEGRSRCRCLYVFSFAR